ncbi:recombination-associated protein RdgC [Myxococcota bacterium]|nr:recombination-associated protein RdgC [Myxococcota bacterium]MBU1429180.1 recombination-associated protein RdgC [Myxococcota bacterium]MBU1896753.1 recombination-associated protein RdgC [Myxococcota bacterium]
MGAFAGSLTFRQYYVKDPLPKDWQPLFQKGIERYICKEIDPISEEERSLGWCSVFFPLDVELHPELYLFNEYIVLGMRIDTLTVPGPLLRIQTESEIRKVKKEKKRERLSRFEKAEIKERVKKTLRKKMIAQIKTIDIVWNWHQGIIRFYSTNEKVNLEMMELFELTFGVQLIPDSVITMANFGGLDLSQKEKEAILNLEPSIFVDQEELVAAMTEV